MGERWKGTSPLPLSVSVPAPAVPARSTARSDQEYNYTPLISGIRGWQRREAADVAEGGSVNPTLHPPPRAGSLLLLSPGSVCKRHPQCQHVLKGMSPPLVCVPKEMSLLPPHPRGCNEPACPQRDVSMAVLWHPKGCICLWHVLKGTSLVPPHPQEIVPAASMSTHCHHCDMRPTDTQLVCSQRRVPIASMSPKRCICHHHVPKQKSPLLV